MNILDALRIWNEYTENYIGGHGELSAGAIVINDLVTAYENLAPDWSEAPDWATHYIIKDNYGTWCKGEPFPHDHAMMWSFRHVTFTAGHEIIKLPLGIDWRLCKWSRTEA